MKSITNPSPSSSSSEAEEVEPILFIIQDDCYKHLYKRSHQPMEVFERPQRLRYVNLGLSSTLAWISNQNQLQIYPSINNQHPSLTNLIISNHFIVSKSSNRINLNDTSFNQIHSSSKGLVSSSPSTTTTSTSSSQSLSSKVDQESSYLDQLIKLCRHTSHQHQLGLSEVPDHLPQGDLYLSAGTEFAVLGAIGACYDALDSVLKPNQTSTSNLQKPSTKAFVNIRPPGHHCTDTEPMGFCWANNVLVSCMYAHLNYAIDRICIVDIDLHHGNGSQQIVWEINQRSQESSNSSNSKRTLKISYSSLHDINSYPCEDGQLDKIREASLNLCVGNSIQQFIQNLHLEVWKDEIDFFDRLYPKIWNSFQDHMIMFFKITDAIEENSLIFVSAGFDACELETDSMSRYGMKLPTSFYHRFSKDLSQFSQTYTKGRVISFLEGGYSDQTLLGSSLSYLLGLIDYPIDFEKVPWELDRIEKILKLVIKKPNQEIEDEIVLIEKIREIFNYLDGFEKSKIEMRSEIKKMGKNKIEIESLGNPSESISGKTRGMKLRSGRLASHSKNKSIEKDQIGIDSMEGMFEKMKIGKEDQDEEKVKIKVEEKIAPKEEKIEIKVEDKITPKKEKISPKKETITPKKEKITPKKEEENKTQTQRLKLVWKSEGIN
ncbi:uncharacterized protein MELLADRAFT_118439 [Melampsora larici-populina 98AG31]|uniref:Histone deacetylase domain-containing protein n=1 Tax=Melampsora larici-populina (strain 98AG31 / pathotype 3-4-7) TaxID=747676 RepID=F4S986_MELLP|nr:uncharacterized protein MELLADRAFT_118439 [Melampsora larici-populina 98AG31]EGF98808.1 hypothetical protein MELLADRAFT_118439 [Melampsora larici-populina 98AG31]